VVVRRCALRILGSVVRAVFGVPTRKRAAVIAALSCWPVERFAVFAANQDRTGPSGERLALE
jgi:hypothetical protein